MKRIILVSVLMSVLGQVQSLAGIGYSVTIDNILYQLYNNETKEAHVYHISNESLSITNNRLELPETVIYDNQTYTVTNVDYFAIGNTSLELVTPKTVKSVQNVKSGVKKIVLGTGVSSVSNLSESTHLEAFEVAEGNEYFSVDNDGILYDKDKTTLICAPYAKHSSLTSFTVPSSVKAIGNDAFREFDKLETIILPEGIKSIGVSAFYNCQKLRTCNLQSTIEIIDWCAFNHCPLSSIELPAQLKVIGESAFSQESGKNPSLSSLTIPQNVESIGDWAFAGWNITTIYVHCAPFQLSTNQPLGSVQNLVVPKGTVDIFSNIQGWKEFPNIMEGDFEPTFNVDPGLDYDGQLVTINKVPYHLYSSGVAHLYCDYQQTINSDVLSVPESVRFRGVDYVVEGVEYVYANRIVDLQLPNTIKFINDVQYGVKILRLPKSVTSVSNLHNSYHLEAFEVAEGNEYFSVDNNGILYDKKKTTLYYVPYGKRESFVLFNVPTTVKTIGDYAFCGLDQLAKVILPDGLTTINSSAFRGCSLLSNCDLPSTIEAIGEYAFSGCKLINFKLPNQLKSIGNHAFADGIENSTLSLLYIPPYVENIGDWVFSGITIGAIYSYIMNPMPISENSFGYHDQKSLVVPTGTKEIYSLMPGWRNFTNITESDALLPTAYKCATPEVVRNGNSLTLTSKTDNATIYYTLDGNSPTRSSQVFKDPIILTENCTLKAFAVKESLYESDIIEYPVDWFVCESPEVTEYDGRYFKSTIPEGTTVYYTFNGGEEKQYTDRTAVEGLGTLRLIARHPHKNDSAPCPYEITYYYDGNSTAEVKSEGLLHKAFDWSGFSDVESLTVSGPLNTSDLSFIRTSLKNVQHLDLENTTIINRTFPAETFAGMPSLISFKSPKEIINVGDRIFADCPQMAALIWNASESLPSNTFGEQVNPNMLVYVMVDSWAPSRVQNRIVNGTATRIILSDDNGNDNFYCPKAFKAKEISYTHNYSMETEIKKCTGWETITLPFTVQKITHETKGELMPFKKYEEAGNPENVRPFWLRTLVGNYFEDVTSIEAYMPYIISMPNNKKYATPYNLAGNVTFSAENVEIQVTNPIVQHKNSISFVPCYLKKEKSSKIMVINKAPNTGDRDAGSAFVSSLRDAKPFEAYTTNDAANGRAFLSLSDIMGTTTGIYQVLYRDGYATDEDVKVYNLSGLLVASGKRDDVMKHLPKGVYIINGKKVVAK